MSNSNILTQYDLQPLEIGGLTPSSVAPANEIGQRFMLAHQIAGALMHATLIPDHLRGERKNVNGSWQFVPYEPEKIRANVMMVVNRALQWGVDPVALIGESFVVGGKLDFQGKVITAVVNKLGGLVRNLNFEYHGKGETLTVTVTGQLRGETEPRTIELTFKDAVTKDKNGKVNEQWTKDVESKLAYSGAKKWARRHTPGVVLGLFDEDDEYRPEPAPVAYIDAKSTPLPPVTNEPLQDTAVQRYEARINASADRGELTRLVDKIKAEPEAILRKDEREYLVSMAKMVYRRKPEPSTGEYGDSDVVQDEPAPPAAEKNTNPVLEDKALHYEAMINEADSPEALDKVINMIDDDKELPVDWRRSLGKLANDRQRQGFAVT